LLTPSELYLATVTLTDWQLDAEVGRAAVGGCLPPTRRQIRSYQPFTIAFGAFLAQLWPNADVASLVISRHHDACFENPSLKNALGSIDTVDSRRCFRHYDLELFRPKTSVVL
jgi:hypothetical protein